MSTRRIAGEAGYVDNGKRRDVCRCGCGQPVPEGRRTFASDECVHGWKIKTQPAYVKQCVWERDHGICALCGADTEGWLGLTNERRQRRQYWHSNHGDWHAHHIVPVCEGGGECGLEGYQTLCCACHKCLTAELVARRKAERVAKKEAARAAGGEEHVLVTAG